MKRLILLFVFIVFVFIQAAGQRYLNYPDAYFVPAPGPDKYYKDSLKKNSLDRSSIPRMRYKVNLGTSFTGGSMYGSLMQSWIAPELSYKVSNKLDLSFGVMVSNNYMPNTSLANYSVANELNSASSWLTTTLFTSGTYYFSEDLVVSATVMKSIDQTPDWARNSYMDRNYESLSFSVDYRLSDAVHLGLDLNFNRGNNPWYMNPARPYGLDPFSPYGGWR